MTRWHKRLSTGCIAMGIILITVGIEMLARAEPGGRVALLGLVSLGYGVWYRHAAQLS